ncbi:class I SAM-dependent methyltransferase [Kaarinaea lacus]
MTEPVYNHIGVHYSKYRRADQRLVDAIDNLLQIPNSETIADVGAGTGNYSCALAEKGYAVNALEPSELMLAQRKKHPRVHWCKGYAENIPLGSASVAAAIAVLAIHHFSSTAKALTEMARIAGEGSVLLFTFDPRQIERPWFADYFPFLWDDAFQYFPPIENVAKTLQLATHRSTSIHPYLLPHDLQDYFAAAGWRRPEIYLDPVIRACMSGFAVANQDLVNSGVEALRSDLESGAWDQKYNWLTGLGSYDVGYRFVVSK